MSSPSNWIVTWNNLTLERTGSDDFWISHYSVYIDNELFSWNLDSTTTSLEVSLSSGIYNRYVIATDSSNNTWKSETRTFTITSESNQSPEFSARAQLNKWVVNGIATGHNISINLVSSKNANYRITGDILSSPIIWNLTADNTGEQNIVLTNSVGTKNIYVTISGNEAWETYSTGFSINLSDVQKPTISLTSPSNWIVTSENNLTLERTGSDDFWK